MMMTPDKYLITKPLINRSLLLILILIVVLGLGISFTIQTAFTKDDELRDSLLTQARLAISGVDTSHIPTLTASSADLSSPAYQDLKNRMMEISAAQPLSRFAYLLKMNPDGSLVFLVDSEQPGTEGYSPPGQTYPEASILTLQVFHTGREVLDGPVSDRWGTFVSGLIPIKDNETGDVIAIFGLDIIAEDWNQRVITSALIPAMMTLLITIIIIFFMLLNHRSEEEHKRITASEKRLRRKEEQLLNAQRNARLGLFEYYPITKTVECSPMTYEVLGFQPGDEDTISAWYETIHPDDQNIVHEVHRISMDKGSSYAVAYRLVMKDGKTRWINEIGRTEYSPDGRTIHLKGTIQDISELKETQEELRKEEERLRLLIRNSSDIVMVLDENMVRKYVSESQERITGYSPDEFMDEPFNSQIIHPDDYSDVSKALKDLIAMPGSQIRITYRHRHKTDGYIYLETIGTNLIDDPVIKGIILNSRDFSEIKRAEDLLIASFIEVKQRNKELESIKAELTILNDGLEDRVSERIRDLEESKEQIELLLNQKDQFIYQLAHDLRTPLTPVVAMLPLLIVGIQDPDAKSLLEIFNTSIEYLQKMVEDILYYAQINRQYRINDYADYFLQDLITDALAANSFPAEQKELTVESRVPEDLMIRLSKSQAHQLFRNLINNAVKYNVFKGTITIEATSDTKWVTVQISDSGVGIPEEKIEQIWDELSTGDTARRDPESKGMGLPIVRRIVILHGGTIEVSSMGTGKGTTFKLRLPVHQESDFCQM